MKILYILLVLCVGVLIGLFFSRMLVSEPTVIETQIDMITTESVISDEESITSDECIGYVHDDKYIQNSYVKYRGEIYRVMMISVDGNHKPLMDTLLIPEFYGQPIMVYDGKLFIK